MKRRIIFSIALALSIAAVSLMKSDAAANAARPKRFAADTGFVTLGPNQILRVTVVASANSSGEVDGRDFLVWQRSPSLASPTCNSDGVCKYLLVSEPPTESIELRRGEAASMDITSTPSSVGVRIVVVVTKPDMQVNTLIIDGATGAVVAQKGGGWIEVGTVQF